MTPVVVSYFGSSAVCGVVVMRVYTCFTLGEINLAHTIFTLCAYNFNFMRSEFLRCAYIIFLLCVYNSFTVPEQ